jgi:PAS domain S-box-containing protein
VTGRIGQVIAHARKLTNGNGAQRSNPSRRVVIADGNVAARAELRRVLEAAGYEVHEPAGGSAVGSVAANAPSRPVIVGMASESDTSTAQLLGDTEIRYKRLFQSSIIGVVVGTLEGRVTDGNDEFLRMVGYSRTELEAGALNRGGLIPPEWRDRVVAAAEEAEATGQATPYELEYMRKDGTRLPALLGTVRLEGTNAVVGFVLDRSEQKAAQEKLSRYARALEGANRELESFSYSVAHDLRAPLRSIDGFSQALLEDCEERLDDDGKKYLRYVRESTQYMAHLIDDLLALSRVTRSELHRAPLDLSLLARGAMARIQHRDPNRQVGVTIPDSLSAQGDARLLGLVFDNLLANAWKFTSKCHDAAIEFGTTMHGGQRTYFIRDNGAGFDMAFANKLFGVFQRLHSASEFEGTGIGLAIVQRIVARHGGRVWAEGQVGHGATFYFTLDEESVQP